MARKIPTLLDLDLLTFGKIDDQLTDADRIMLSLCSKNASHFMKPVIVNKCTVAILDCFTLVHISGGTSEFFFEMHVIPATATNKNMFHLKSERGEFATVEFDTRRGHIQKARVKEIERDVPRFVSHLHSLFPWTRPTVYNIHTRRINLEKFYSHMDLPFLMKIMYSCIEWRGGEDLFKVPDTCRQVEGNYGKDFDVNAFLKSWQAGNQKAFNCIEFRVCNVRKFSYGPAFDGITALGLKNNLGMDFVLDSRAHCEERKLVLEEDKFGYRLHNIEITMPAGNERIDGILEMIEKKKELEKKIKMCRSTRKRTADATVTREEVEEELKTIKKKLKDAGVTFTRGMASIQIDATDASCFPFQNTTFLFAYSNDFSAQTIGNIMSLLSYAFTFSGRGQMQKYTTLANVVFDTKDGFDFQYHSDKNELESSVEENLPDPENRFPDNSTRSNVADMLRAFLSHKPVCGSVVFVAMKRNSRETDLSDVVQLLRNHHVLLVVVGSTRMVGGGGGEDSRGVYEATERTSGVFIYSDDERMGTVFSEIFTSSLPSVPVFSFNRAVNGTGSIPVRSIDFIDDYNRISWFEMVVTVQDHALTPDFHKMTITFSNEQERKPFTTSYDQLYSTFWRSDVPLFGNQVYNVTLEFEYESDSIENVEIRMFVNRNVTNWPPFEM